MFEYNRILLFKGTMSRDFLLLVFFMNQFPPTPEYPVRTVSNFRKFAEIFASQGPPPVSTTPAAILPPVSNTPVANNGNNIRLHTPSSELEGKIKYILTQTFSD
jgi:hypothetical protein